MIPPMEGNCRRSNRRIALAIFVLKNELKICIESRNLGPAFVLSTVYPTTKGGEGEEEKEGRTAKKTKEKNKMRQFVNVGELSIMPD
mmetsp:Transcript_3261/g.3544  ORF Transcript_3261/g.3544 Transcript_3261/m.3544 type:complete len:87 (-) Transcript_3261:164-424(-)